MDETGTSSSFSRGTLPACLPVPDDETGRWVAHRDNRDVDDERWTDPGPPLRRGASAQGLLPGRALSSGQTPIKADKATFKARPGPSDAPQCGESQGAQGSESPSRFEPHRAMTATGSANGVPDTEQGASAALEPARPFHGFCFEISGEIASGAEAPPSVSWAVAQQQHFRASD